MSNRKSARRDEVMRQKIRPPWPIHALTYPPRTCSRAGAPITKASWKPIRMAH